MKTARPATDAALCAESIQLVWVDYEIHEALRMLRYGRAMDQFELSRRANLSQPAISQLETGHTDPPWSTVKRVWRALDCHPLLLPRPFTEWAHRHPQWRAPDFDGND